MNLFSKLSVNPKIEENHDKVTQLVEVCTFCLSKKTNSNQISQQKISENKSRVNKHVTSAPNPILTGIGSLITPSLQKLPYLDSLGGNEHSISNIGNDLESNQSMPVIANPSSLRVNSILNPPLLSRVEDQSRNIFKSSMARERADKSETKTYSNMDVIANLNSRNQPTNCQCLFAMQSYAPTKLGLTYLCYVRFPDGSNSLLKAENFWQIIPENPVSLNILLKNPLVKLNESLGLILVIKNSLTQEIDLVANESSFRFKYSLEDKNFGSLILENKITRNICVGPMSQDSVSFFFMPIKCGIVELESVAFFDQKTKKEIIFECRYKILIN